MRLMERPRFIPSQLGMGIEVSSLFYVFLRHTFLSQIDLPPILNRLLINQRRTSENYVSLAL